MFEKEAEEYFENECLHSYADTEEQLKEDVVPAFQKGAEFGYNKANEWHYVKDGKYPKDENKIYLLYLGDMFNPTTGWYKNGCWCFEDDRNENIWQDSVIAWKEIVLPKESE